MEHKDSLCSKSLPCGANNLWNTRLTGHFHFGGKSYETSTKSTRPRVVWLWLERSFSWLTTSCFSSRFLSQPWFFSLFVPIYLFLLVYFFILATRFPFQVFVLFPDHYTPGFFSSFQIFSPTLISVLVLAVLFTSRWCCFFSSVSSQIPLLHSPLLPLCSPQGCPKVWNSIEDCCWRAVEERWGRSSQAVTWGLITPQKHSQAQDMEGRRGRGWASCLQAGGLAEKGDSAREGSFLPAAFTAKHARFTHCLPKAYRNNIFFFSVAVKCNK